MTSSVERGVVGFIEILLRAGEKCRLCSPWGLAEVELHRNGARAESLRGSLLEFPTQRGKTVVVAPSGTKVSALKRAV